MHMCNMVMLWEGVWYENVGVLFCIQLLGGDELKVRTTEVENLFQLSKPEDE